MTPIKSTNLFKTKEACLGLAQKTIQHQIIAVHFSTYLLSAQRSCLRSKQGDRRIYQFWFVWFGRAAIKSPSAQHSRRNLLHYIFFARADQIAKQRAGHSTLSALTHFLKKSDADSRCCTATLWMSLSKLLSRIMYVFLPAAINPVSDQNKIIYVRLLMRADSRGAGNK